MADYVPTEWADVEVLAVGSDLTCRVTGDFGVLEVSGTDPEPRAGVVGISDWGGWARFDDFAVFSLDP